MPKYPNTIGSKLPKVGTTIFTVMSQLAFEEQAINLSQGYPDFPVHPKLLDLVEYFMRKGYNQYAPMAGVPSLREQIVEKTHKLHGTQYDPDTEVTVTAGATQALFTAITAIVKEGDEVILFTPAYDSYAPVVELNGGKPIYVQLKAPDYTIDWNEVKKVVTRRTRMILINSPHNPTGSVLREEDLSQLERLTNGNDITVLSDEVYEHIVFDGAKHQSVARFPKLADRSFVVASFGKTFHCTGWKMGYCLAPANLMAEFRKVHQFNVFTCNTPMQLALAEFLKDESHYLELAANYQEKRNFFLDAVAPSRFKALASKGTYFQLLDYSAISEESDTDYAVRLTKEMKVASIPVSVFYHSRVDHKVLRFCFAKQEETLAQAAEILNKI
ncbi:MAG: methionine aminotransferase [Salibacteraceae bacterium]